MAHIALNIDTPSPRAAVYSADVTLDVWPEGLGGDHYAFTQVDVINEAGETIAWVRGQLESIYDGTNPSVPIEMASFTGAYYAGGDLDGTIIIGYNDLDQEVDTTPARDYDYMSGLDGEPIHTYRLIIEESPKQDWTDEETSSGLDQVGTAFRLSIYDLNGGGTTFIRDVFIEGARPGECLVRPVCGLETSIEFAYVSPTWTNFRWDGQHVSRVRASYGNEAGAALYKWYPNDGSFSDQIVSITTPSVYQVWEPDNNDQRILYSNKDNGLLGSYYVTVGEHLVTVDPEEDPLIFYSSIQAKVWSGRATVSANNIIAAYAVDSITVLVELYRNDEVMTSEEFNLYGTDYQISNLTLPNIPIYGGDLFWVRVYVDGDWGVSGEVASINQDQYALTFTPVIRDSEFGSIAGFRGIETATSRVRDLPPETVLVDYYQYKHNALKKVRADKVLELSRNNPVEYHGPIVTTRNNTGYEFGGQTSLSLESADVSALSDMFSVEMWFRADSSWRPDEMNMISFPTKGFWIKTEDESTGYLTAGFEGSTVNEVTHEDAFLFDDRWHHLAMTYDSTTLRLYVDGDLQETLTVSDSIDVSDPTIIVGDNFFGGLDDVAIYDYALSPTQVISRYLIPRGK